MDYLEFEKFIKAEIPMNRKEKFFSATVFPSILFHNGISNFFRFLNLIDNFPKEINLNITNDNFLFFTEYSLKQSAGKRNVGLQIEAESGEIPDILIEILKPKKSIIIIEAKMFQNYPQIKFDNQLCKQKNSVINSIRKQINIDDDKIFHIGLVPEKLGYKNRDTYQIINWEILLSDIFITKGNHFVNYLRFALQNYESLVEDKPPFASTVKNEIKGSILYEDAKSGSPFWVGRQGGEQQIIEDAKNGKWKKRNYSWNDIEPTNGRIGNWITGKKFAEIINQYKIF